MTTNIPKLPKSLSGGSPLGWHFMKDFKNCETYWWNRNLRPHPAGGVGIEPRESREALAIGTAFHRFAEFWYLSGWDTENGRDTGHRNLTTALDAARRSMIEHGFDPSSEGPGSAAWAIVEQLAIRYHAKYGPGGTHEEFPSYRVHSIENRLEPMVEQEFWLDLGYNGYLFTARLDLIVQTSAGLLALEHKTSAASLAGKLLDRFQLDGQATAQSIMLARHFPDEPIVGVELNVAVKDRGAKSSLPMLMRERTHRSEAQLEKFEMDAVRTLRRIDDTVGYYDSLLHSGMGYDEAARVAFDGNPDGYQCVGAFGKCAFFDLCNNRQISDHIVGLEFEPRSYEHYWENPYAQAANLLDSPTTDP